MKEVELIQPLNKKDVNKMVVKPLSALAYTLTIPTKFKA